MRTLIKMLTKDSPTRPEEPKMEVWTPYHGVPLTSFSPPVPLWPSPAAPAPAELCPGASPPAAAPVPSGTATPGGPGSPPCTPRACGVRDGWWNLIPHHPCPSHLRDVGKVLLGKGHWALEENLLLWAHLLGMGVSKGWEEGWEMRGEKDGKG